MFGHRKKDAELQRASATQIRSRDRLNNFNLYIKLV